MWMLKNSISIIDGNISDEEYDIVKKGFADHDIELGVSASDQGIRCGTIARDGRSMIGCASGLLNHRCFYLTDLWVSKKYRSHGIGKELLEKLENQLLKVPANSIYTWTVGKRALKFYQNQGYTILLVQGDYYKADISRYGLQKLLR